MAKLAETHPWSVGQPMEMYGKPRPDDFTVGAAEFSAIRIKYQCSCIRAPPEAEKAISGQLSFPAPCSISTAETRALTTELAGTAHVKAN